MAITPAEPPVRHVVPVGGVGTCRKKQGGGSWSMSSQSHFSLSRWAYPPLSSPPCSARISFRDAIAAPEVGPHVVIAIDLHLVGLQRFRIGQRDQGDLLGADVDAGERAAERIADPDEIAILVGAEPPRPLRPRERGIEIRRHEGFVHLALFGR